MEKVNIDVQVINNILAYLQTKPYQEVIGLINLLHKEISEKDNKEITDK